MKLPITVSSRQMTSEATHNQPDCLVSGALALFLRLSRLAGIAPLCFVKKGNGWCITLSRRWNIYGYFMITIINLIMAIFLIIELRMDQSKTIHMKNNTRLITWVIEVIMMTLISGLAAYGASGQMRSMMACLNQVHKINSELKIQHKLVTSLEYKKNGILLFWTIMNLTLILMNSIINLIDIKTPVSFIIYVSHFCCYWIVQLREKQFFLITLHVMDSFKAINNSLESLLHELEHEKPPIAFFNNMSLIDKNKFKRFQFSNTGITMSHSGKEYSGDFRKCTSSPDETLHRLALLYAAACDVVRAVDRSHGLILLLILISILQHLIFTPVFIITDFILIQSSLQIFRLTNQLLWCFFAIFNLVVIIEPCHLTHAEAEKTRELLSHLTCHSHSLCDPFAVELERFFKLLMLNEVSYKPMNVTSLSRALVITILGSIVTYLIVIIQL